ncbi:SDR family oxidoreductase [Actinoplanes sp. NPDC051470]|uniref:SDR family NAD(P)-dependent oxidoreductase n=1 Tax=Actinoplanes sp. NPDC051470 TaxID=3157224 RepID=UPI003422E9FB
MNIDIAGKRIVVTGAAQGIGRTLALGLASEGARVGVLARDRDRAQAVVDEIEKDGGAGLALEADVSDEEAVRRAAAEVDAAWGGLDGLINNAGWMPGSNPVLDLELDTLQRVLNSNVVGAFLSTKHFAPLMIKSNGGRIVYVSSIAAVQHVAGGAAYSGSKAALNALSACVHQELAGQGIRTVALAPGLTVTPGMRAIVSEEHVARVAAAYPGGRIGEPEDLVALTAFLCSDAASHLSGTTITVRPPVAGMNRI